MQRVFNQVCFNHVSGWIVDSGSSLHMTYDKTLFSKLTLRNAGRIKIANGDFIPIKGFGSVRILFRTDCETIALNLSNVVYVPDLDVNLLSVNELNKEKYSVLFEKSICKIKVGKEFVTLAHFTNNNFLVNEDSINSAFPCVHEWHRRLAHRNVRDIKRLRKHGLEITKCACNDQCDACMKGKSTALPFTSSEKPNAAFDIIVSDVCGPLRTQSRGGAKYFLTITDVFSDYTEVKFMKHKNEVKALIMNFIEYTKNQLSKKPKIFRSDNGGEFVDSELKSFFLKEGIRFETTVPNTPQQNGIAERKNRTLNDSVRTLLIARGPTKFF